MTKKEIIKELEEAYKSYEDDTAEGFEAIMFSVIKILKNEGRI